MYISELRKMLAQYEGKRELVFLYDGQVIEIQCMRDCRNDDAILVDMKKLPPPKTGD